VGLRRPQRRAQEIRGALRRTGAKHLVDEGARSGRLEPHVLERAERLAHHVDGGRTQRRSVTSAVGVPEDEAGRAGAVDAQDSGVDRAVVTTA